MCVPRPSNVDSPSRALMAAIFTASFAAVYLQVTLMKLGSLMFDPTFVFAMIGVTLLGYGAAGSLLAIRGGVEEREAPRAVARHLVAFAVVAVPTVLLVNSFDVRLEFLMTSAAGLPLLFLIYGLFTLPFVFVGFAMSSAFAGMPRHANLLYFADLLGAGAGGAAAVLTMPYLGGLPLVAVAGLAGAIAAAWALRAAGRSLYPAGLVAALNLVLLVVLAGPGRVEVHVAPDKHGPILSQAAKPGGLATEFSRWSHLGRIDVTEPFAKFPPLFGGDVSPTFENLRIEQRMLTVDGIAPAFLFRVDTEPDELEFLAGTSQSPAYILRDDPKVLVIGVGGGTDVLIALSQGASHVTGVEINGVNVEAVRDVFGSYVGNVLDDPRVDIIVSEGRHHLASDPTRYDIIQMSGVDTGTRHAAFGLGTMPESYLYTTEAFEVLLDRLTPTGIVSMTRDLSFGWAHRLTSVARTALARRGLDPGPRIVVLEGKGWGWATLLVSQEPFSAQDLSRLREFSSRYDFPLMYDPGAPGRDLLDRIVIDGVGADGAIDLRPSTDDWPFFFVAFRWDRLHDVLRGRVPPPERPVALFIRNVISSIAVLGIAAIALIGLPLWRLRAAWRTTRRTASVVTYFALLGAAFMLIEVGLMQRFTVFLGHPVLAVATVLSALLVSSGVGSLISRTWAARGGGVVAVAVTWIVLAQLFFASPMLRDLLAQSLSAPLGVRLAICVTLVGLAGLPMGMPFPVGLSRVAVHSREFVPWAWGINGMVSVVASLGGYLIGMVLGYTAMFYIGAVLYLGVGAVSRRLSPTTA